MKLSKLALAVLVTFCSMTAAVASPTYTYVGNWQVSSGPYWGATDGNGHYTTGIYSGVEAAAAIFGGTASDYVTSTVGANAADIDFQAWYDGYGQLTTKFSDTWHADPTGTGLYANVDWNNFVPTWSAWVSDHGATNVNYAFRVDEAAAVPEPAMISLFGLGLVGLSLSRRNGKKQ
jgi:hypothetical protein